MADFLIAWGELVNLMQGCRYLEIMYKDKPQDRFARGCLNRVDFR